MCSAWLELVRILFPLWWWSSVYGGVNSDDWRPLPHGLLCINTICKVLVLGSPRTGVLHRLTAKSVEFEGVSAFQLVWIDYVPDLAELQGWSVSSHLSRLLKSYTSIEHVLKALFLQWPLVVLHNLIILKDLLHIFIGLVVKCVLSKIFRGAEDFFGSFEVGRGTFSELRDLLVFWLVERNGGMAFLEWTFPSVKCLWLSFVNWPPSTTSPAAWASTSNTSVSTPCTFA